MGNIWARIAAGTAVILVIIIGLSFIPAGGEQNSEEPEPKKEETEDRQKTYQDVIEEDDKRLRAEPQPEQKKSSQQTESGESTQQQEPRQFVKLRPEEETQARRLYEHAINQRKMARLPGTGYGHMVDYCRKIIEKFPGSKYAYKARRMLGEVPERYRSRYDITEEEISGKR